MYCYDHLGAYLVSPIPRADLGPETAPPASGRLFALVGGDPVLGRGSFKVTHPGQLTAAGQGLEALDASRLPQGEADQAVLAAIREGKRVALANKETLVCAGELVMAAADRYGAEIVPVDSEHSAIFQCLQGCRGREEVKKILLTCSGGPFYGRKAAELQRVTRDDALQHPNWKMGEKITVDCATLMNKGLEVIEAMRLYRLPLSQVEVLIHRQSIVHSLVEFRDGAVLAQLGTPDMRLPIRYALTWPQRAESFLPPLDLLSCPPLTFAAPDRESFPCLALAEGAARRGGTACAILNGANEAAVGHFLRREIGFPDIPRLVAAALERVPARDDPDLEDILAADAAARRAVESRSAANAATRAFCPLISSANCPDCASSSDCPARTSSA